ncbi:retrotransposon protein, putative, ty1-copia subclass [Tanacetum coccineum]
MDWYRNLRMLLSVEDKLPYLEQPIPAMPIPPAGQVLPPDALNTHTAWVKASKEIAGRHAMTDGAIYPKESWNIPWNMTVLCKIVTCMGKTVTELHAMLKLHEQTLPPKEAAPALHAIRAEEAKMSNALVLAAIICSNPRTSNTHEGYPRSGRDLPPMCGSSVIPRDDIYEIDLSSSNTNDSSIIIERIEKLQHDGLLNSTDIKSFEKCVSCMSGKMARKPYSHQVERAKDLLGLIHTDKTIKSLRSDRGGEYMSQEFLDHLKEHGIIAHRTPPYTPQHNGVSERRNRTLLDMVRSMMSQTTLPKSFWDYALESAARILNMVPTKKGCEALVKRDTLTKPENEPDLLVYLVRIGQRKRWDYSFYYPPENKVIVCPKCEIFENSLITQEASGSLEDLEIIQEEYTHPSIDTSLNHEEDD